VYREAVIFKYSKNANRRSRLAYDKKRIDIDTESPHALLSFLIWGYQDKTTQDSKGTTAPLTHALTPQTSFYVSPRATTSL